MALNMMFIKGEKELNYECYEILIKIFKHHIGSIREMFNNSKSKPLRGINNTKSYDHDRVLKIINEHKGTMTDLYRKIEKSEGMSWVTAINTYKKVMEKIK